MKGAMALPWVITINAPRSTIMTRIGNSQYFLRTRRKLHSSLMNEVALMGLELVLEGFGRRTRGLARDPVALRLAVEAQPQGVLAEEAHDEPRGGHHDVEEDGERDGARDSMQEIAESKPQAIERREEARRGERQDQECARGRERPEARRLAAHHRQHGDDREERREDEAEGALGGSHQ